jgi:hypothetical protein
VYRSETGVLGKEEGGAAMCLKLVLLGRIGVWGRLELKSIGDRSEVWPVRRDVIDMVSAGRDASV